MKLYHFALFFAVIVVGFFVSAQTILVTKMQEESLQKTEYDCLVAAVNAAAEVAFAGSESCVTEVGLELTEEVFFQTLGVLKEGSTDMATREAQRESVPCLVVFDRSGYHRFCRLPGKGYGWTEIVPYEEGKIPEEFYVETEEVLLQYHSLQYGSSQKYRMESAKKGVWEQGITPPCVFAIYASDSLLLMKESVEFLYAASGRTGEAYFVTEDNYCHLAFCEKCKEEKVVARYTTQKESAEDGAIPCEDCMK